MTTALQSDRTTIVDPRTGHEVWKLTSWDDCHCLATYMYFQSFTPDLRYLIFASNRSGRYEMYRLELDTGETVQLTDRPEDVEEGKSASRYNVHPNGREVVFRDGNSFKAIEIATGEDRLICETDGSAMQLIGYANLSGDRERVVFQYTHESGCRGVAQAPYAGGPIDDLFRLPSPDKSLSHLQGATGGGDAVTFCIGPDGQNDPNGSREDRARCHRLDIGSGKAEPFLVCPPGHRATHEYWGPDGRLYYHRKSVPGWTPTSIDSIDGTGDDHRVHFASPDRKLGHSAITRDGSRIVSDVQDRDGNELHLIDVASGTSTVLCWPDSTLVDGFVGHVHPAFDFTGTRIVYTSDVHGKAAVYVVPLPA